MEISIVGFLLLDSCIKWESCTVYVPTDEERAYFFETTDTTITNLFWWKTGKLELEEKMKMKCIEWEEAILNPEH